MDLSVIIPIYNHEDYIEQCLNSILEDFPENSEIIIIDDVCTDLSIEKIKKIGSEKIKIYKNEKNMGCAYSLNRGIEVAKGKYIGINYSDDFVEEGFYKKMLEVAKAENADVVCANIADYNDKTQKTIYNDITAGNIFYEVYKHNMKLMENPFEVSASFLLGHWTASSASTKIIKKQFYEKYKFEGSKANDIPAIYPIMAAANKIIYYPNLYLFYREVENSLSRANDMDSYNSVGDSMVKAFELMDDIENSNAEKEVLFFNNCMSYLLYVLNQIADRDKRFVCMKNYIRKLHIYDNNIFQKMKQSKFYISFLTNNKISQEVYDMLKKEKIVDFIVEMEKNKIQQVSLQDLEEKNIANKNLQLEIEKQKLYILDISQENEKMKNQISSIKNDKQSLEENNNRLENEKKGLIENIYNIENEKKELIENIYNTENERKKMEQVILNMNNENESLQKEKVLLEENYKNIVNIKDNIIQSYENSLSWKITKPIRKMCSFIKKKQM